MNHVLDLKRANVALTHRLAANDPAPVIRAPEFRCPTCGTGYFEQQPCDWCPGDPVAHERSDARSAT